MSQDPIAELHQAIDQQRHLMEGRLNKGNAIAGIRGIINILSIGFVLVLELGLEIRERLPKVACENCQDCGRVSTDVASRVAPLVNYCPKGCRAAQRELLRDQQVHQLLNPQ